MKLQAEFVRCGDRVLHVLMPLIGAVADGTRRQVDARVEHLHTRDPDALHIRKIGLDAVLGHVAVDPMPPNERSGYRRWCGETGIERIGTGRARDQQKHEQRKGGAADRAHGR